MMKPQPSGTAAQRADKKPSLLCRALITLVGLKLCLLCIILVEPFIDFESAFSPRSNVLEAWNFKPQEQIDLVADVAANAPNQSVSAVQRNPITPPQTMSWHRERKSASVTPESAAVAQLKRLSGASGLAWAGTTMPEGQTNSTAAPSDTATLDALKRRQEELDRKEQDLKALQQELDAKLVQLQALETKLSVMLKDADSTQDAKYKHLVDVLSNMKARQAAEVLSTLDERIAVKVLAGMRGRQAGEILTYAKPTKAARLTEALARMQMPM